MSDSTRDFEIVLWGASGFTGKLTAEYLLRKHGAAGDLRWAIGGRNREKLERVRRELADETGVDCEALPILVGDSDDAAALEAIARRTKVVCTTVGPYAKYGSKLVEACAKTGTDYCDLTGEVHWMARMIEAHADAAEASGARIVFTTGFDCIPSDLGVFFLQRETIARHGTPASQVQLRVKGFSGGASGGTIASMLTMLEEAGRDSEVMRVMNEPYSLNPKDRQTGPDSPERFTPSYDEAFGQWVAPFVMAGINTKVVRRSNALLGFRYGEDFRYDEAMLMGAGPAGMAKASATSFGSAATMGMMAIGPIRRLVSGRLPQPGDGPTKAQREKGYFDLRLRGTTPDGRVVNARVRGDRDPGYGSTAKMLAESALCLARDTLDSPGGMHTPASAMGEALLARMPDAGVTFEVVG
ncbi:MAG: saccharopine dehydrogenase NADP-binding domain-containing protein [bacterium]|nr:saccharopine dehydrogenase NADP-binding domain-containing protein [bacterium]